MAKIKIPFHFKPRSYQVSVYNSITPKKRRSVWIAHRRAGKDKTALNLMIKEMVKRKGIYYYFLPTYKQGRKVIWDGMDLDGFRFIHHIPGKIIENKNKQEMKIRLKNGSLFQIIGTDKISSIVGTNPIGCVFSEYAIQSPIAWQYIRPIFRENNGWAMWISTPRGHNHCWDLYRTAKKLDNWSVQVDTVDDTGVISPKDIEQERKEGMPEELVQQEYYCSWEGYQQGSYYTRQMQEITEKGQLSSFGREPQPVETWWDLGIGDNTAILFTQVVGRQIRIIDAESYSGEGLGFIAKKLQEKPYTFKRHHFPHDADKRELGTGKSIRETAKNYGIKPISVVPKLSIEDGITAVRAIFPKLWINEKECETFIDAVRSYHREYDDKKKQFKKKPCHDWSSDYADALRYLAVGFRWSRHRPKHSIYHRNNRYRDKRERNPVTGY